MKKLAYILAVFLFILSWCITGFVLYSDGIRITNTYHQYQNQQQAQLMFGLSSTTSIGNVGRVKRTLYTIETIERKGIKGKTDFEKIHNFLITLSPEQSIFAIISQSEKMVSVPVIEDENN